MTQRFQIYPKSFRNIQPVNLTVRNSQDAKIHFSFPPQQGKRAAMENSHPGADVCQNPVYAANK